MAERKTTKNRKKKEEIIENQNANRPGEPDANRDPITGEPGAHPFGVAGGGTGGAVTGAAIGGAVGGPIGAAVGGAIGAVAGGLAGKAAAEVLNPTTENEYWKQNYRNRPYYKEGTSYEDYEPAYRHGWEYASRSENRNRPFEEVEDDLQRAWEGNPSYSERPWNQYREASRDSYERAYTQLSDTADIKRDRSRNVDQSRNLDEGDFQINRMDRDNFWNQIEGNWLQIKGSIKAKWNQLTDDEVEEMEGRREVIVGKIQEKYGEDRWSEADIQKELIKMQR